LKPEPARSANPPDTGLRKMLTWTLIALVGALLFSTIAVYFTIRLFAAGG
jgi:hypothetical protein